MNALPSSVLAYNVLRLDWSAYSRILECWRKGWYHIVHKQIPAAQDEAKVFGKAIHAALDVRQKAGSGPYSADVKLAMEAAVDKEFLGVELQEDEFRTAGRAREVLGIYNEQYPVEPFKILASELSHERELGQVRWHDGTQERSTLLVWQMRTDGIWQDLRNGRSTTKDTKTTKHDLTQEAVNIKWKASPQLKMYCWGFSDREFGVVRDAVVDLVIVRKPLVRPTAKSKPRNELHRLAFHFSEAEVDECKRNILALTGAWLTACAKAPPPLTGMPDGCCRFNRACGYWSVCENASEQDRLRWLYSGQFKRTNWNPMTGRDDED